MPLFQGSTRRKQTEASEGVRVIEYDESDPQSFIRLLKEAKVEVFISAIGLGGVPAQKKIASWVQEAGIKLFVPRRVIPHQLPKGYKVEG